MEWKVNGREQKLESRNTRVGRAHGSGSCGLKGKKKDTDREAKVCCFKYGGQKGEETPNHTLILVKRKVKKKESHIFSISGKERGAEISRFGWDKHEVQGALHRTRLCLTKVMLRLNYVWE